MFFSILSIENDEDRNRMVEIYESYAPYVYKCISDYSVEWHKRDDVSQEVFKRLIENTASIVALQVLYALSNFLIMVFLMIKKCLEHISFQEVNRYDEITNRPTV